MLANAGHFDVEIDIDELRKLRPRPRGGGAAAGGAVHARPGRRLNLLARGRVVNLAAGEGHPPAAMDMSFANLALAVEHLVAHAGELPAAVIDVPREVDDEIARAQAGVAGRGDRRAHAGAGAVPGVLVVAQASSE